MTFISAIATNIQFDTDGQKADLPSSLHFLYDAKLTEAEVAEQVEDGITEATGYCHSGFDLTIRHDIGEGDLPEGYSITKDGDVFRLWRSSDVCETDDGYPDEIEDGHSNYRAAVAAALEVSGQLRR